MWPIFRNTVVSQNDPHFVEGMLKYISLNEMYCSLLSIIWHHKASLDRNDFRVVNWSLKRVVSSLIKRKLLATPETKRSKNNKSYRIISRKVKANKNQFENLTEAPFFWGNSSS